MPSLRELKDGAANAFANGADGMQGAMIEAQGEKHTPAFIRSLGCLAPVLSTVIGATILVISGLKSPAPENAVLPCATGLGMIAFGLFPALKKLIKK